MDRRAKLRALMKDTELKQVQLARALGVAPMTVSRWLTERVDAIDPPDYALSFLSAFKMLDLRQRRALMLEVAPRTPKADERERPKRSKPKLTLISS